MTDNFKLIRDYMKSLGIPESKDKINDKVFEIEVLRRGKDCPGLPAANYSFKNYYVDSLESYDRYEEEIKQCCKMFRLRAYVSVNVKSKTKLQLECLKIISDNLCMGELKKPWKIFYKAFGKVVTKDKRWVIDIDDKDSVNDVKWIIEQCKSTHIEKIVLEVPTKSGIHLITHPFNVKQFNDIWDKEFPNMEKPEIKENHLTLLYEDLN